MAPERLSRLQRRLLAWLWTEDQRLRGTMVAEQQALVHALVAWGVGKGNVSTSLKGLEAKGWVRLTRTPGGRAEAVDLTAEGRNRVAALTASCEEEGYMGDISENVSQIRRRGRPPRYHPAHMALASHTFVEVFTTRGQQNKVHLLRAHGVLKDEPGFEWLIDKDGIMHRKPGAYRQTILQELGRIEDTDTLKAVARQLCKLKPTAREAVAMIRRVRLGPAAPAEVKQLVTELAQRLDDYRQRHPDLTTTQVCEALDRLQVVIGRVQEADDEA